MRNLRLIVTTLVVAALGVVCLPTLSSAQKAIVYCPPSDVTGCDNVVAALAATGGPFAGGVDRGYDGTGGTLDLATVDLSQYSVFVVPSLSDDSSSTPYALLRSATIASRLNAVFGRVALWSGTPDIGSTNTGLKETLLRNLAAWASGSAVGPRSVGLVALQDFSDDEAARYGWLTALTGHSISADTVLQAESSVQTITSTGATILDNNGTALTYANLASFGFVGTSGWSVDANGADGSQAVLVTTQAIAAGGSPVSTTATVSTDKPDYPPFDTVTVSGTGWQPGETVSLLFHETPQNHQDRTITTTADGSGNIRNRDYSTDDMSLNVSIALTATGQTSGRTATVTFTDGPCVGTVSFGAQVPIPLVASGSGAGAASATIPVTVSRKSGCGTGSGGTPFSVTLTTSGAPAGATLSATTLNFSATDPSKSTTLTITAPATTAPKSYGVSVTATSTSAGNDNSVGTDSVPVTGGLGAVTVGPQSPSPLPAGHSATYTVTVNRGSSTGNFTANLTTSGLPAGATSSFSPASVSFTSAAQTSQQSTLTITSTASLPAGSFPFGVSATNPLLTIDAANASATLVTSAPATKLAFTTPAFTIRVGLCSPKITIQTQNGSGAATNPASARTIALSTSSSTAPRGQFFSDPACATEITSISIPTSASSADFYYKDGTAGAPTLTATDNDGTSPLTPATQKETLTALPATTVAVTSDSPSEFGEEVTFTATVAPVPPATGTPSGTVQFSVNGTATGAPAALANGVATFKISTLAASNNRYTISAAYSGDANFAASNGQLPTTGTGNGQMVNKANTATTLASSKNPSNPGEAVVFTATVLPQAPGGGVATGTVQLKIDGTNSGSAVTLTAGSASFPATTLNATGTHVITAVYANQDGNYNTSTGTLSGGQVVQQTSTTLAVATASGVFGGTATLSATLTAGAGALPGQIVSFSLNGQPAGNATTDATGKATVNTASLTGINAGTYPSGVGATFIGGGSFGGSTGANSLTVDKAPQAITFDVSALTKKFGDPSFPVTATASSGLAVTFASTTAPVCTVTSAGQVTIVTAGACTLTASQAGNTNFLAAADVPSTITIGKASQTIAFDVSGLVKKFGDASFTVTATASSGLAVAFASTTANVCTVTATGQVTILAAGACTLTASQPGNTSFVAAVDVSSTVTIGKAVATLAIDQGSLKATFDGTPHAVVVTTTPVGLTPVAVKYDAGTTAPTDAGSYAVVASLTNPNYDAQDATGTLVIDKATPTIAWADPADIQFNTALSATQLDASAKGVGGAALGGTFTYTPGTGTILHPGQQQTLSVAFMPADSKNYNGVPVTTAKINVLKGDQTIVFAAPANKTYGDAPFTIDATASSGLAVTFATAAPCSLSGSTLTIGGAGTCTITASQAGSDDYNKAPDVVQQLTIYKALLTITADDAEKVYGAPVPTSFTAKFGGFVNGDTPTSLTVPVSFTTTATAGSPVLAGGYKITPAGATSDNYKITFVDGTLTVTPAPLTIAVKDAEKVYGAPVPSITTEYVSFVNGDTPASLGGTLDIATTASQSSSVAGSPYSLTPGGLTSTNYHITFVAGKLTVTPAPLTITANDAQKVYGAALPTFSAKYDGFVNNEDAAVLTTPVSLQTAATDASPVVNGGYKITASGATSSNYKITFADGTLTVTPAPLTITANDASKVYGANLPAFTVGYDKFVLNETSTVLGGTLNFTSSATMASTVSGGPYTITPSGLTSSNYSITFRNGSLNVTPAPLTITATSFQKVYGAPVPQFTVGYDKFVLGESPSVLGGALAFSSTAAQASTVTGGPYAITPSGYTSTNYSISFKPGYMTITPAPLTVAGVDRQKVFDGLPYPFNTNPVTTTDVSYSGFVLGENSSVLGGPLSFSQGATTLVGSYSNTASGLTSTNYAIAYVPAKLSILAWTLAGFYQPVDMNAGGMVYNTVKGGSTVPMKFNIYQSTQANTNERTDVGAVKSFTATPYVCTAAATDEIEIVSTGGTALRYDVTGHQFIQNWATPKSPGTCYKVTMTALDGTPLTAYFLLK
jgi:hypothetical protein